MKKIIIFLIGVFVGFGGYHFYNQPTTKPHKLNFHQSAHHAELFKKWVSFEPNGENFIAAFPKKPKMTTRDLPVPGGADPLPYKEFKCTLDEVKHFSVSYTTLPESWLKYGDNLVLGGALKVIMQEMGNPELVGKESTKLKSFSALDYEHYTEEMVSGGTLVLVGNTLYKVEITHPRGEDPHVHDELCHFLENFAPALEKKVQN
ncbi:hypothetical protein [Candidatus Neptunochlamydia vexilliferae]|uniref:Uncharacterized protein n=1 Tax=Candidatus Neptunichlamydia vexilliferae TaxID=1651774 RepID=A0ABS0AYR0_9BACT|nr:hypothetical protein [Candidatus Neptunochlamydia vexilliferae]MBF5059100.1 hypothetical protein [Candidatus Neptunochlamydia vexilliferae]